MKASELLREALALIEDPKNWTQKAMSRGMEIDGKPEQFCAIGALQWAGDQHACWPEHVKLVKAEASARRYLNTSACNERIKLRSEWWAGVGTKNQIAHTFRLNDGADLEGWDEKTRAKLAHEAVLRAFGDAIKRATARGN